MPRNKLSDDQVAMIRVLRDIYQPKALAREYGVSRDNIYLITSGRTHKGYTRPRSDRGMTPDTVRRVRRMIAQGASDRKISKELGVSRGSIYQLRIGKTYGDI